MKPALAQPRVPPRECVTASVGQGARSLRDGSTREDELEGVGSNVSAYKGLTSRANFPTPDGRTPPQAPSVRDGGANSQFGSAVHSSASCDSIGDTFQSTTDSHQTLSEVKVSNAKFLVNLESAIPQLAAKAVSGTSAKVIHLQTGIKPSTIYHIRQARTSPSAAHWDAIKLWAKAHKPEIAREIERVLSGDVEYSNPENIAKIIANLQGRGSG